MNVKLKNQNQYGSLESREPTSTSTSATSSSQDPTLQHFQFLSSLRTLFELIAHREELHFQILKVVVAILINFFIWIYYNIKTFNKVWLVNPSKNTCVIYFDCRQLHLRIRMRRCRWRPRVHWDCPSLVWNYVKKEFSMFLLFKTIKQFIVMRAF